MSTIPGELSHHHGLADRKPTGPVTAARLRRTALAYGSAWVLGLLPALLGASPAWQAAGLGLWLPGAGFLAVGGWATLLFPLALLLFAASVVAWFWAGVVLAPFAVWLGAALLAGLTADAVWGGAHVTALLCMAAAAAYVHHRGRQRLARDLEKASRRQAFLPDSVAEVSDRAARQPDAAARELEAEDLPSVRYLLDRALQPIDAFDGFDIIDQFQPAALRYQLNHMGFALGLVQGAYTPNFQGYLGKAQRNLIDKYLLRRVWDYWVYESCWGHLNFRNFDPAARDNIMLTGWFGMHVGQYMLNSGDRRYGEPASLTFRLNARTAYPHDFHSIIGSVVDNYTRDEAEFCLFPCEPNWIYPICNHYGMTALAAHDRLYGTHHVERFLPSWLEKLDTEFTDASGSIIGLRSQLTGIEFPFPVGEAGYACFANCFAPERARRLWAIAREEMEPALGLDADGRPRINLPGRGLDAGNYSAGHTAAYAGILMAAREFGDDEIAEAAQRSLDQDCDPRVSDGVRHYEGGSNLANADAVLGRLMRTGDFRRAFVEGPADGTLQGPVLTDVRYPAVLVARAFSRGDDLDLVLYPGSGAGRETLGLRQLVPGRSYAVAGAEEDSITADAGGTGRLNVVLNGRTAVHIRPASA